MKFSNYLECRYVIAASDYRCNFKIEAVFGDCGVNSKFSAALTSSLPIFTDLISLNEKQRNASKESLRYKKSDESLFDN